MTASQFVVCDNSGSLELTRYTMEDDVLWGMLRPQLQ